jgi:Lon protease-like protein
MLFPHAMLPLHVFELRYRTMIREALSSERVIAIAQLKPGYETDYHASPPFHELGCLARINEVEWLPNDCYDVRVLGLCRVNLSRIVKEFPYRAARVEIVEEAPHDNDDPLVQMEQRALLDTCRRWMTIAAQTAGEEPPPAPSADLRYEVLVNAACMLLGHESGEQLNLLAMDSVLERGKRVRELLEQRVLQGPPPVRKPEEGGQDN